MGVVAGAALGIDQRLDEVVRLGELGRGDDLLVGRIGPAIGDVLLDRAMQQRRVLRHDADIGAQRVLRDVGDVGAVDRDDAALAVVEAQQQVDDGRLAGARAADETDLLARTDVQVELVDDAAVLAVVERDIVEADVAIDRAESALASGLS